MNRKYSRPDVKVITRQWVRENCKNVTDRDLGLLYMLVENKRRLLRRDQLERLYPTFASTDRLNKRLSMLFSKHIIDKIYPQVGLGMGSSKQHICLDRAGILLMDLEGYNKPIITDSAGNRMLFSGWEHKVSLNEYECIIREVVHDLGGKILMYEVEEPHLYHGEKKIIPDIFCLVQLDNKGFLFFIEVDLGTENVPYIKDKLDSYKQYYLSKAWTTREWAKIFKTPTFPRLLFLTENGRGKRKIGIQNHIAESSLRCSVGFHSEFRHMFTSMIKG